MISLGRHIVAELYNCSLDKIDDVDYVEKSMIKAADKAGATIINSTFHHFSPYGVSGVVVIQESHLAIHAWPEYQYAAVDIFTCGTEVNPWIAYDYLKKAFEAGHGSAMEINRGQTDLLKRAAISPTNVFRQYSDLSPSDSFAITIPWAELSEFNLPLTCNVFSASSKET